ncbi:MAG: pyruvate, water dikinase, partial [Acidobacteria bacterium]|nr:pyruvate, water dikinase [Acidobacteriota bacterium]
MTRILEYLRRIFSGDRVRVAPADAGELRRRFQVRYHHFKLLLNANNKALEVMSDMERALQGGQPFGMSFVKSACTAVSVSVLQITRNLDEIAPGRYAELHDRFKAIQENIHRALGTRRIARVAHLVLPLAEIDKGMADEVGSKMANLGEIAARLRLPVPAGFAVTALGYQRFMEYGDLQAEIDRRIQAANAGKVEELQTLSAEIRHLIVRSPMPPDLAEAIGRAYSDLEGRTARGARVSLRSSALGEDLAGTSFAGQYLSQLNVDADNILEAYKEIVASKYTLQAMTYRFNRGIRDEDVAMCVGCMAMVCAEAGGVAYSRNPVSPREEFMVISSTWGLPKAVVDGISRSDLFVVSRDAPPSIV